jgi:hypothetical protein
MTVTSDAVKRKTVRRWIAPAGGPRAGRPGATERAPWRIPVSELERLATVSDPWTAP